MNITKPATFCAVLCSLFLTSCIQGPAGAPGRPGRDGQDGRSSASGRSWFNKIQSHGCRKTDFVMLMCTHENKKMAAGSATIIDTNEILTAEHVIEGCDDGLGFVFYKENLVGVFDTQTAVQGFHGITPMDTVKIKIDWFPLSKPGPGGCKLTDKQFDDISVGDDVTSIGYPGFAMGAAMFRKEHIMLCSKPDMMCALSGQWMPGTSGSPIFDTEGNLFGIMVESGVNEFDTGNIELLSDTTWMPYL